MPNEPWSRADPSCEAQRSAARCEPAGSGQRDLLCPFCQWAALPEGPATEEHGATTTRWSASTRCSMRRCAKPQDEKRVRRRRSSIPRAPSQLKKGLVDRSARLRCGQEGNGPQASHPRRYARSPSRRERSARRHSGPQWRARFVTACAAAFSALPRLLCRELAARSKPKRFRPSLKSAELLADVAPG
jgi:hypothetical protein